MRTVGTGNAAQPTGTLADLTDTVLLQVADHTDTLQDLTGYAVSLEYDETADEVVNGAVIVFRRNDGSGATLAPLMVANPPLAIGRRVLVSVDVGADTKEVFSGRIDKVQWPNRFADVVIYCRDQGGAIADTWVETKTSYGNAGGTEDVEDVAQDIADDHLASAPTIYVPAASSTPIEVYPVENVSVLSAVRTLAEVIGWTIRWRYIDGIPGWRWTLFEPSRAKTTPDHTFGTSDYWDVTAMEQDIEDIRNVVEVAYFDEDGEPQTVIESDATSITAYGRRYMKIQEASDSPIRSSALATALAEAALSDLKDPDAVLEVTCSYFWPGEIGVDLYRFSANSVHFGSNQDLAPVAFRHRIATGELPTTKITCRGKPSAGVNTWNRRRIYREWVNTADRIDIDLEYTDAGRLRAKISVPASSKWESFRWSASGSSQPTGAASSAVNITPGTPYDLDTSIDVAQLGTGYLTVQFFTDDAGTQEPSSLFKKSLRRLSITSVRQLAAAFRIPRVVSTLANWTTETGSAPEDGDRAYVTSGSDEFKAFLRSGGGWSETGSDYAYFPVLLANVVKAEHIDVIDLAAINATFTGLVRAVIDGSATAVQFIDDDEVTEIGSIYALEGGPYGTASVGIAGPAGASIICSTSDGSGPPGASSGDAVTILQDPYTRVTGDFVLFDEVVEVGASDSGGTGYRMLRVAN